METQSGFALVAVQMTGCKRSETAFLRISIVLCGVVAFTLGMASYSYAGPDKKYLVKQLDIPCVQAKSQSNREMWDCATLKFVEIDSTTKHNISPLPRIIKEGYYNLSSLALLFGEGQRGYMPFPSLTMVNGYCFQPGLFTGIGLGYEYLDCSMMPIFADVKYILPERRHIPFVSLKLGGAVPLGSNELYSDYGFAEKTTVYGGILISPEFGVLFPQKGKNALLVSVGYHHQEISYENFSNRGPENLGQRTFVNFNRISFRISYLFR